ncbi:MAG TPA: hypothetical protein VGE27_13850 [Gemmatimonas sp.]|uniref:HoxN/HupN/NixA family nickel/cobalt transporter n=1 Tax=Gemmatimonas sp. TaxID=1962908 RepID=UPI002ED8BB7A
MTSLLLSAIGVGFVVGFRHAFEPDHLAAVTTLATREGGLRGAARLGVSWGLGHTASVAVVALVLIALDVQVPDRFYAVAELGVAFMLLVLGVGSLVAESRRHRNALGQPHRLAHAHHAHHQHAAPVLLGLKAQLRALGFGVLHGLAGSGAVIVLIIAAAPGARDRTFYLLAFGVGTVVGMSLVSALSGATTTLAGRRHTAVVHYLRLGAAMLSVAVGLMLGSGVIREW